MSLQYGDCALEVQTVSRELGIEIIHDPAVNPLQDMDVFFAQVAAMDLIISTSNTTAHVAAAIGRPTWVMLRSGSASLWYWFKDRNDSPWYPSVCLFRQIQQISPESKAEGGLDAIARVAKSLEQWVGANQR